MYDEEGKGEGNTELKYVGLIREKINLDKSTVESSSIGKRHRILFLVALKMLRVRQIFC